MNPKLIVPLAWVLVVGLLISCKEKSGPTEPNDSLEPITMTFSQDLVGIFKDDSAKVTVMRTCPVKSICADSVAVSVSSPSTLSVSRGERKESAGPSGSRLIFEDLWIFGKAPGSSRVVVTSTGGNPLPVDTIMVVVNARPSPTLSITISPTSVTMAPGVKFKPTVTVTASAGLSTGFICFSSDATVATVDGATCEVKAIAVNRANPDSPIQVYAETIAVHPVHGKLRAFMNVLVKNP